MIYKLRPEYKGLIISIRHSKIGMIKFDVDNTPEDKYEAYYNMGFSQYIKKIKPRKTK